jgi:hypothetical protein
MDLNSLINTVTVLAASATVVAVQILKSPLIPLKFQNYPVLTATGASIVATYLALLSTHFSFVWKHWTDVVAEVVTVLLVASLTYTHIVAKSPALKALEVPKDGTVPAQPAQ